MIWTFCNSNDDIGIAGREGAAGIIIEHSRTSVRSFVSNRLPVADHLSRLVEEARQWFSPSQIAFNCDMLVHDSDVDDCIRAIDAAAHLGIREFRIQDIGLISLINERVSDAVIWLNPEIGCHSETSIRMMLKRCQRLTVGNEVPIDTLLKLSDLSHRLDIQVQGPILIQYSYRRYIDGTVGGHDTYHVSASDSEYPGRKLRFWDSPNGTAMFLYFDRCLLREIDRLRAIGLSRWIIDCRGQDNSVLSRAIRGYRDLSLGIDLDIKAAVDELTQLTGRPQRPGFFNSNNTDQDRASQSGDTVAVVRDVVKDRYIVLEFRAPVMRVSGKWSVRTSKGEYTVMEIENPRRIADLSEINQASVGDLLVVDWKKGITPKSTIFANR